MKNFFTDKIEVVVSNINKFIKNVGNSKCFEFILSLIDKIFIVSSSSKLKGSRVLLRITLVFFTIFIIWSTFFSVEQVVRANGQIIAASRTQVIQTVDGGILTSVNVKEGDFVTKDQVLANLDTDRVNAIYNETHSKVVSLELTKIRLESELAGKDNLEIDVKYSGYENIKQAQINLFDQRRNWYLSQLSTLKANVDFAQHEVNVSTKLEKSGDISKSEVLKSKKALNDAKGAYYNHVNKYLQDVNTELAKVNEDLFFNNQVLIEKSQSVEHSEIRSPVDGYIKNIKFTTIGGVLRSGDVLLEIVPNDSAYIVEAKLLPSKIAFIKVGQPVTVKLDAYDYSIFGSLRGKVVYISPDSLSDTQGASGAGPVAPDKNSYYKVRAELLVNEGMNERSDQIQIKPGLTATIDIGVGKRNVLSLLLLPFSRTMTESFAR